MFHKSILPAFITLVILFSACKNSSTGEELLPKEEEEMILKTARGYFTPLSEPDLQKLSSTEKNRIELGKKLFYDKRLSGAQTIHCGSCHNMAKYGADNLAISPGDKDQLGRRNPPTLLNAHLQSVFNWDARYKTLEEQVVAPIFDPSLMAMPDSITLLDRLIRVPYYQKAFREAFPDDEPVITLRTIGNAIGAFERTLTSPSRFDDYLNGDIKALTTKEKQGIKSFVEKGCIPCHSTTLLGGNMTQKFALFGYYWDYTNSTYRDKGRYEYTKNPAEEYVFKVPQLRNIEKTYPYMHDGSVGSLEDAIRIMSMTESNLQLDEVDVEKIAAFLRTLTGKIPKHALEENGNVFD
ncbi:MAG TPA: cytochrome c peroxidase [Saprospiraceae bacterium]|nr:cytochrome-c peroxidase [Saprospirales bacterium]HRQ30645.1 cytochrome c peroxidase [Saprospiraceae bacterium]